MEGVMTNGFQLYNKDYYQFCYSQEEIVPFIDEDIVTETMASFRSNSAMENHRENSEDQEEHRSQSCMGFFHKEVDSEDISGSFEYLDMKTPSMSLDSLQDNKQDDFHEDFSTPSPPRRDESKNESSSPEVVEDSPQYSDYSSYSSSSSSLAQQQQMRNKHIEPVKSYEALSDDSTPATPTGGRNSPFMEFFRRSRRNYSSIKVKNKKQRASSPLSFFKLRKSNSLPQCKDSRYEIKHVDDTNHSTRLVQPSPFVRTIYQYLDDDSDFSISGNNSCDEITVHASGLMKRLQQEGNPKSSLKNKTNKIPLSRTLKQDSTELAPLTSGRRISECSDCIISTLAMISREKHCINDTATVFNASKGKRKTRHNSDPLEKYLSTKEVTLLASGSLLNASPMRLNDRFSTDKNYYIAKESNGFYDTLKKKNVVIQPVIKSDGEETFERCFSDKFATLPRTSKKRFFRKTCMDDSAVLRTSAGELKGNELSCSISQTLNAIYKDLDDAIDFTSNERLKSDVVLAHQNNPTQLIENSRRGDNRNARNAHANKFNNNSKKQFESSSAAELKRLRTNSFIGKFKNKYKRPSANEFEYWKGSFEKLGDRKSAEIVKQSVQKMEENKKRSILKRTGSWRKKNKDKSSKDETLKRKGSDRGAKISTILSVFEQESTRKASVEKPAKPSPLPIRRMTASAFLTSLSPRRSRKFFNNNNEAKKNHSDSSLESERSVSPKQSSFEKIKSKWDSLECMLNDLDASIELQQNENKQEKTDCQDTCDGTEVDQSNVEEKSTKLQPEKSSVEKTNESEIVVEVPTYLQPRHSFDEQLSDEDRKLSDQELSEEDDAFLDDISSEDSSSTESLFSTPPKVCIIEHVPSIPVSNMLQELCGDQDGAKLSSGSRYQSFSSNAHHVFDDISMLYNKQSEDTESSKQIEPSSKESISNADPIGLSEAIHHTEPIKESLLSDHYEKPSLSSDGVSTKDTPRPTKPKPPPIKPKPIARQANKTTPSLIAKVSPFMKETSKELGEGKKKCEDDSCLQVKNKNTDALKRSNTIASGEVTLKRKPSVIWAKVKNMEVTMVVDCDYGKQMKLKIESFEVRRMNTHCDVENIVTDTFMKHLQLLDKDALGLTIEDIKFLKLDTHNIPIGRPFNLSDVNIVDHFLPCQLYLKDKSSWSLSSIVYDTLIPKSFVEKYISTILSNNFTVFYGPSGTGKSYLARRLSHFTSHRINESSTPVILTNITPTKWKNLLKDIVQPSSFPKVYLLDGLTQGFLDANIDLTDIVRLCEDLHPKPYVICTFTLGPQYTIPSQWQQQLKWIWLPNQEEPVDTLLERYLRRKFIQFGNFHLQREYFRIVKWLADVWRHLNRIIQQFSEPEATLGPTLFFPCPTDLLEAEDWFSDLWNYSLCPYFIQSVGGGIKRYGQRGNEWTDPLQWIVETYPWSKNSKHKLTPITMADTGYVDHAQCNESSQNEKERLLHFLSQLELLMLDGGLGDLPFKKPTHHFESSL